MVIGRWQQIRVGGLLVLLGIALGASVGWGAAARQALEAWRQAEAAQAAAARHASALRQAEARWTRCRAWAVVARAYHATHEPSVPQCEQVLRVAERYGVAADDLAALVLTESGWNARAVSGAGARGLGQIMPATAAQHGVPAERLFDPDLNLELTAKLYQALLRRFGDPRVALRAYNRGPGGALTRPPTAYEAAVFRRGGSGTTEERR